MLFGSLQLNYYEASVVSLTCAFQTLLGNKQPALNCTTFSQLNDLAVFYLVAVNYKTHQGFYFMPAL